MERRVGFDKHHINFNRQEHDLRPESRAIRATPELIPLMDKSIHAELHRNCPPVPVIGHIALFRVLRNFEIEQGDTFQTLDNLCFSIEQSNKTPKAHRIERAMSDLTIDALRLQIPFIREGIAQ